MSLMLRHIARRQALSFKNGSRLAEAVRTLSMSSSNKTDSLPKLKSK
jgi:hypothetical protein